MGVLHGVRWCREARVSFVIITLPHPAVPKKATCGSFDESNTPPFYTFGRKTHTPTHTHTYNSTLPSKCTH
jgi:hypothetical protein